MDAPDTFTGAELDTLVALVEAGPLFDGDVPSKSGRDSLIERGLAVRIVQNLEDGYTAATYAGRDAYTAHFGTALGGQADTMREARANRIAKRAMHALSGGPQ
jgi:hypothetical protein